MLAVNNKMFQKTKDSNTTQDTEFEIKKNGELEIYNDHYNSGTIIDTRSNYGYQQNLINSYLIFMIQSGCGAKANYQPKFNVDSPLIAGNQILSYMENNLKDKLDCAYFIDPMEIKLLSKDY